MTDIPALELSHQLRSGALKNDQVDLAMRSSEVLDWHGAIEFHAEGRSIRSAENILQCVPQRWPKFPDLVRTIRRIPIRRTPNSLPCLLHGCRQIALQLSRLVNSRVGQERG